MKSGVKSNLFLVFIGLVVLCITAVIFYSYTTSIDFTEAELAYVNGDWSTASDLFTELQRRYPWSIPDRSEEVSYYLEGAGMLKHAQELEANEEYEEAITEYNNFRIKYASDYTHFGIRRMVFEDYKKWGDQLYAQHEYAAMLDVYQEMLSKFEKGPEIFDLNFIYQRYPDIYYQWAKNLWENGEYEESGIKYSKVIETFPDSPLVSKAEIELQDMYLEWAESYTSDQDYKTAFSQLDDIQKRWPLSRASDLSNDLYVEIGLKYAGELHADLQFKEEADVLDTLLNKYPCSSQIDVLNATRHAAYMAYANQSFENKQYFDAVAIFQSALKNTSDEETIVEINEKIAAAYDAILFDEDSEGKAIVDSIVTAICDTGAELPAIVSMIPNNAVKIVMCPSSPYEPAPVGVANSLAEIKYVVEVTEKDKQIEDCPYGIMYNLLREQKYYEIIVYNVKTGKQVTTHAIQGGMPDQCPDTYTFSDKTEKIYGTDVDAQEVDKWFEKFLPH